MPLAAAPTGEATPIVETSNGDSLPATFNLSVCLAAFFKPLAKDRSLAPSGPSRRNMLRPLRVDSDRASCEQRSSQKGGKCAYSSRLGKDRIPH
jgi:hypothetical protein